MVYTKITRCYYISVRRSKEATLDRNKSLRIMARHPPHSSLSRLPQETCYGSDRFNGWTPDKEEGIVVEGMQNGIWRKPFKAKETIYGRLRGDFAS